MKISEIPFDPEKGLEGLEMLRNQKNSPLKGNKTIRFAVYRPPVEIPGQGEMTKAKLEFFTSQPCHGRLQRSGPFDMCATGINKGSMDGMYEYFVKDSPFGRFVLNRDTYEKDGWIAITGDLWYPFQNCLNIFVRQSAEGYGPWMQKQFDDLISRGTPPLVALLVTTSTTMYKDPQPDTTHVGFRTVHSLVSTLSVNGLRNFFAGEAPAYNAESGNKPTVSPTDYNRGVYCWEEKGNPPALLDSWLSVFYRSHATDVEKNRRTKKSYSPFESKPANYAAFRRNEFCEHALPQILDLYYSVHKADRIPTPSVGPAGETLRGAVSGVVDTVQEYGNAFARAVGIRN